jgi:thiol-disulfide isomerase/thioredoxin
MRAVILVVTVVGLVLAACSQQPTLPNDAEGVDFSQQSLDSSIVTLSDHRGSYVALQFWASWCGPCRAHTPGVVALWERYKGRGLVMIGVSLDYDLMTWRDYVQQNDMSWLQVADGNGWENPIVKQFDIKSTPTFLLVDPNGRFVGKTYTLAQLDETLNKLLP